MKILRILPAVCIAVLVTPPALAQFGLYGSPDVLNLPQASQAYPGYATAVISPDGGGSNGCVASMPVSSS